MKKNFIYLLAVTLFMGLFAACSQEETSDVKAGKSNRVSISADLPAEFATTRALPSADGHKLRCILEVWSQGETPELIYRTEKLGTDATGDKLSFEFNLESGIYDCRMWADFIDANADLVDGRYTDKYYNTADLTKVAMLDASKLYNSDFCDAFFASTELNKTDQQEIQSFDATLKRPLAKLIVSDKSKANFARCKKVSVSHRVAESFNVAEGTASVETVKAVLTDATPIGAGDTDLKLFSCYAFADADGALKEIELTFKGESDVELRRTAIPAGVAFKRNNRTLAKGYLIAEAGNNTQVEVGVDDKWEADVDKDPVEPAEPTPEVEDPKVGSFYYADGTWSEVLNENKECVGIIFALAGSNGAAKEDVIANYPEKGLTQIKGWVVAINEVSKLAWASAAIASPIADVPLLTKTEDAVCSIEIMGYKGSQAIGKASSESLTFPAQAASMAWLPAVPKTSGWYMPSIGQLITLFDVYEANSTFDSQFTTAGGTAMTTKVYLSSTLYQGKDNTINPLGILFDAAGVANVGVTRAQKATSPYYTRPVLTF